MPLPDVSKFSVIIDASASIVGIIGALALVSIVFLPTQIQICTADGICRIFTKTEYETQRSDLATKYENGTAVSFQEYQTFVAILDKEIKKKGTQTFTDITDKDVMRKKVADFLRTNP